MTARSCSASCWRCAHSPALSGCDLIVAWDKAVDRVGRRSRGWLWLAACPGGRSLQRSGSPHWSETYGSRLSQPVPSSNYSGGYWPRFRVASEGRSPNNRLAGCRSHHGGRWKITRKQRPEVGNGDVPGVDEHNRIVPHRTTNRTAPRERNRGDAIMASSEYSYAAPPQRDGVILAMAP